MSMELLIIRQALRIWRGDFPDSGCKPALIWNRELSEIITKYNLLLGEKSEDSPIKNMDDFYAQFVEDLDFDVLIGWADLFGIDHDYKSWLDDDYPDKESELRGQLAEAMGKVGEKKERQK